MAEIDARSDAIGADTARAEALAREAVALRQAGRIDEAIARWRESLTQRPDHPPTLHRLANALRDAQKPDEAVRCFRQALIGDPSFSAAWANLGLTLQQQGDLAGANDALAEAVRIAPSLAEAHCALGLVRLARGARVDAIAAFGAAIAARPDYAIAHHNLAGVLMGEQRIGEALAAARHAVRSDGTLIEARRLLAQLLELSRRDDEAAVLYEGLLAEQSDDGEAAAARASIAARQCDWDALARFAPIALASIRRAIAEGRPPAGATPLLSMLFDPRLLGPAAALWSADIERQALAKAPRCDPRPVDPTQRPLRIGYLSGDFRNHATMHLIASLFGQHDRRRVTVHAYGYGPDDRSDYRRAVENDTDCFVDVTGMDDAAAAARIRADGIDILVDLKGHTGGNRLAIAALRPAPLQVTCLGFPGPVGAGFIDYALVDPIVVPPGHRDRFVENLCYLSHCYQPNGEELLQDEPAIARRDVGLDPDAFVLCSFNSAYKLLPDVYDRWLAILVAVPGIVLWMLADAPVLQRLRARASARDVDPLRVVAASFVKRAEHLRRLRLADLALDTTPINGHTTTSDCLRVGVPVLTVAGDSFAANVSASLLATIGLPELIATDMDAYEAIAIALAHDPARLASLRATLRQNRETSPLFDMPRFAADLEIAYETMWQHRCTGALPRVIEIGGRDGRR
ncbi:MAG: tetratricopeptide repeat protein [Dongiaceae bacterium]